MTIINKQLKNNTKNMRMKSKFLNKMLPSYIMLAPQLIGFAVFTAYPIIWAISLAWFNYNGIESHTKFVAWDNFRILFTGDPYFWGAWKNTVLFALMKIPIEIPLSFMLALMLNKKMAGSGFYRSMYYLPSVISMAIIGLIFSNMFNYFGVINGLLQKWGIINQPIEWFSNTWTARWTIVIASIWQSYGINVLYFMAALQNIPKELYECSALDGANRLTTFFKITLPMIAPVMQIILMLSINGTMMTSELVLVMTNGAPAGETNLIMSYLISKFVPGFAESVSPNIGYGCALSIVTACILACITAVYLKVSKRLSSMY